MGRLFDCITSKSKEEKQKSLNQKMDIIQKEIESIDPVEELEKGYCHYNLSERYGDTRFPQKKY